MMPPPSPRRGRRWRTLSIHRRCFLPDFNRSNKNSKRADLLACSSVEIHLSDSGSPRRTRAAAAAEKWLRAMEELSVRSPATERTCADLLRAAASRGVSAAGELQVRPLGADQAHFQ